MQSDAPWFRLEEVVDDILDRRGVTPLKLGGDFTSSGHRVISAKVVKCGRIQLDADEPRYISTSIYQKWMRTPLCQGDVIMTSEAPLGELAFLGQDVDWVLGQRLFAIRPKAGRLYGRFLYYVLQTESVRADMLGRASGTTVQGIRQSELRRVRVPLPKFETQVQVADFLGALDDRIDVLRQTNATLEAISQALFKSWFIDFEPVRAKSEGREPEGMDAAMAALFPAEFEESTVGMVPKGWTHSNLGVVCAAAGGAIQTGPFGSQLHASDYVDEGIPVVMPQDMRDRRVSEARIARVSQADADRLARHKLSVGDIVFSRRGDVGRHATVSEREVGWLCGTGCLLVRPGAKAPSPAFLSQALAHSASIEWLQRHAVGATMPNLNTGILEALPLLNPADAVLNAFEDVVGPLENRITLNHSHASSLGAIRDQLLPRLVSGNLSLPDAQERLEGATT